MSVQLNTIYNDDCPKCMNTKEELRDILEEHHSIVTDELGERLITALDEYIQDRESALLSRAKKLVGKDYLVCENYPESEGSYCNKCFPCKVRNDFDFGRGYDPI